MRGNESPSAVSDFACAAVAAVILLGLVFVAVRLKALQVDSAADYGYAEGGTISGGTSSTLSQSTSGGGGQFPGGPGGRW